MEHAAIKQSTLNEPICGSFFLACQTNEPMGILLLKPMSMAEDSSHFTSVLMAGASQQRSIAA
jgi:hypothetical protein